MGKVDDLRAMRERSYESRMNTAHNVGDQMAKKKAAKKAPAAKKKPAAKKAATKAAAKPTPEGAIRKDGSGHVVQITIRSPLTQRTAQQLLHAAAASLQGGAKVEQLLTAVSKGGGSAKGSSKPAKPGKAARAAKKAASAPQGEPQAAAAEPTPEAPAGDAQPATGEAPPPAGEEQEQ